MKQITSLLIFFFFLLLVIPGVVPAQQSSVLLVEINGTIDQSTVSIVSDSLKQAQSENMQAVVFLLDTPGGGLDETFQIADLMKNSQIPVIGYVSPSGAAAWSAGTFILMSTPFAAMADHTVIGSCQPVETTIIGTQVINDSKVINALVAWIQERASLYGRNQTLAKEFITDNKNVNATVAKNDGVIEFVASSVSQLLDEVDGRNITTASGMVTLHTKGAEQVSFSVPLSIVLYKIISNPILTILLLVLGVFALIVGLATPGHGAEVFGIIAILLALVGLGFNVSTLAIIFIIIGALLLIIEIFVIPGFGAVGIGGIICLILGAVFLIPSYPTRKWLISSGYMDEAELIIIVVVALFAIFFAFLVYKVIQIRRKQPTLGRLVGEKAVTIERITPEKPGFVRFQGEYWQAKSDVVIEPNTKVEIVDKEETTLIVKPLER
ncbi:MAG TPA: nodulation protein NfeD [Candidatus Thermoplasmatota archaeon]|nr:nodulation protein NfeD [Candidatus Thermoplasmatota archaeon]